MAFADPQTITVNAVAKNMDRIRSEGLRSEYATPTLDYKMTISHQTSKKRVRRMVRVDNRKVVTDPLTTVSDYENLGCYFVIDEPEYGFDDTEIDYIVQALKAWMSTANVLKVLGSQS